MNLTTEDYQRIEARITEMKAEIPQKAATDPEFREALVASPRATIEKYYGFPEGMLTEINIQIFEEAPESIGLVIPPPPSTDGEELTEDQLEAIAGGAAFTVAGTVAVGKVVAKAVVKAGVTHGIRRSGWV